MAKSQRSLSFEYMHVYLPLSIPLTGLLGYYKRLAIGLVHFFLEKKWATNTYGKTATLNTNHESVYNGIKKICTHIHEKENNTSI